jgi:type VI secretion system protein VasG
MISVNIKPLLDRLGGPTLNYLHNAAGLCVSMTNYEVSSEHCLLKILEDPASDISLLLRREGQDSALFTDALTADVQRQTSGAAGKPVFSPFLLELIQEAWLAASLELGLSYIRSAAVILALTAKPSRYLSGQSEALFTRLSRERLLAGFSAVDAHSSERQASLPAAPAASPGGGFIARYCEDFTANARQGKIDPVFGRDAEIRQVVDILARRRKNNPILVGEPGVGKTALMEGLALRVVSGEVLKGTTLLGLDMGRLEAGAGMKGEFENRLQGIIDEIKGSPVPIILFIDEAHTLIGAGASPGGSDAANLLKPALARGELRTCAATTWKEYKKYFEKDAALSRRFQMVALDEPSAEVTGRILLGLKDFYEKAHGLIISDDAVSAAADYADRYISGRFQPDKAVDLLDTACARVKVGLTARPAALEDAEQRLQTLERRLNSLRRNRDNFLPFDRKLLEELSGQREETLARCRELEAAWRREQAAVEKVLSARAQLRAARQAAEEKAQVPSALPAEGAQARQQAEEAPAPASPELERATEELRRASEELALIQKGEPGVFAEVGVEAVARVVADWTGIPLGRVGRDQAAMIMNLRESLARRVRGQEYALQSLAQGLQAAKAGLRDPAHPLGVFLLTGPSGTGKTETALALAEQLFGSENHIITVNMGEFQEKHTVSRLIGSPPGYVGYGEGGMLTEAIRRQPYSVVLLDEVEKAHPDIMNLFYQVFDKGVLNDGEGKEARFRNAVIILTSNMAAERIERFAEQAGPAPDMGELVKLIRPELNRFFKPALVGRMTVLPFLPLSDQALSAIVNMKLARLAERLRINRQAEFAWDAEAAASITARCTEVETGARNIEYIIEQHVLPALSRTVLAWMGEKSGAPDADRSAGPRIHLRLDQAGQFAVGAE